LIKTCIDLVSLSLFTLRNNSNYRKKIDDQTTELEHLKKVLDSKEEMEKKQTGKKFSS
jgi:hypothetical protein